MGWLDSAFSPYKMEHEVFPFKPHTPGDPSAPSPDSHLRAEPLQSLLLLSLSPANPQALQHAPALPVTSGRQADLADVKLHLPDVPFHRARLLLPEKQKVL